MMPAAPAATPAAARRGLLLPALPFLPAPLFLHECRGRQEAVQQRGEQQQVQRKSSTGREREEEEEVSAVQGKRQAEQLEAAYATHMRLHMRVLLILSVYYARLLPARCFIAMMR